MFLMFKIGRTINKVQFVIQPFVMMAKLKKSIHA